jgi:multicomponent Na+:H+ antiporter subunit C
VLPVVATSVFLLTAAGVYLLLERSWLRVALGLSLLAHAFNLLLLSAGRWGERAPIVAAGVASAHVTDPLPQAFILTAIVISMALTVYRLAAIAARARDGGGSTVEPAPEHDGPLSADEIQAELRGHGS